jgi:membrane protease YdiL (CAAX protease family)
MTTRKAIHAVNSTASQSHIALRAFFVLAVVLLLPFLVYGAITGSQLAPGLPVAAVGVFCPMLAAMILMYWQDKLAGVVSLLKRTIDVQRIKNKWWYAPLLLIMPMAMTLSFWVQRLMGIPIPTPRLDVVQVLALCIGCFIGAVGEELGWSGYATEPLQTRWGALKASLLLGLFWAVYHYIGLVQAHRSVEWIAWWTLYTVAIRVIMVWLFNQTGGSVFGMILFHMTINVTWLLYPVGNSFFDPRVTGSILVAIAASVVLVWGRGGKIDVGE